jgi:hypothetical protein
MVHPPALKDVVVSKTNPGAFNGQVRTDEFVVICATRFGTGTSNASGPAA